ncbi:uncharacterized protein [Centruroides vittatus]|uniref:uncharacterized protein n=1 Tax=Centruroides vittatus TaxID=120091 RepID=UPI00350F9DB9
MAFLDCYVGEAGSVHDAYVFRRSALHERVDTGDGFFSCGHILGDSAYPLSQHLLTPYRDNGNLNSVQKLYNNKLAKCRNIIERAFAHLVGRFMRLKFLDMCRMDLIVKTIIGACIFHNISIQTCDVIEVDDDFDDQESEETAMHPPVRKATTKRDDIANGMFVRS